MTRPAPTAAARRVVFKYVLAGLRDTITGISADAEVVHVAEQHGKLCAWIALNPDRAAEAEVTLTVVGTGHPWTRDAAAGEEVHVGTVLTSGGHLVLHVFRGPIRPTP